MKAAHIPSTKLQFRISIKARTLLSLKMFQNKKMMIITIAKSSMLKVILFKQKSKKKDKPNITKIKPMKTSKINLKYPKVLNLPSLKKSNMKLEA
jgi:hypothetical protein